MYSVNLIKTEQHAAQAPALHERFYPSKSDSSELFGPEFMAKGLVTGCGSLVLKSIKRSVINIRRSMLDVRCSTFNLFAVQPLLGDLCSNFDHKRNSDEESGVPPADRTSEMQSRKPEH
jgi:hypothetical protein